MRSRQKLGTVEKLNHLLELKQTLGDRLVMIGEGKVLKAYIITKYSEWKAEQARNNKVKDEIKNEEAQQQKGDEKESNNQLDKPPNHEETKLQTSASFANTKTTQKARSSSIEEEAVENCELSQDKNEDVLSK